MPEPATLYIGFSGGLDSTVLLYLLHQWRQQKKPEANLVAVHVNHQIHPDAPKWQAHCQRVCEQMGVTLQVETVALARGASLEQQARLARYDAFRRHVSGQDALLLAHHRDDQVETLLQRLARGSGVLGGGAMEAVARRRVNGGSLTLLRPLLEQDRSEIEQFAREAGLSWVEDPGNIDTRIERNFLRHRVLPVWRTFKPQLNQTLARNARLNREASELLSDLAQLDLGERRADAGLPVARLSPLTEIRQKNLLRYWMISAGVRPPSEVNLLRILDEVMTAAEGARPAVSWGQCTLRRYREVLYLTRSELDQGPDPSFVDVVSVSHLDGFRFGLGQLRLSESEGNRANNGASDEDGNRLTRFSRQRLQEGPLRLTVRQGGETLRLPRQPARSLKYCFQNLAVPPWLRNHWPLLYCGNELAGVPGLLVCEGFEPISVEDSLTLDWHWRDITPGERGFD